MKKRSRIFAQCANVSAVISAICVIGCAAATPAARWDSAERMQITSTFTGCEFFEDEDVHMAGYSCELGSFRAHDLKPGEDHTKASKRIADEHAKTPFTAPLESVVPRDDLTLGGIAYDASIATYHPEAGTIIPPEVMVVLTPKSGNKERAFSCAVTLMAGLDTPEAIQGRVKACLGGVELLIEASREK